jgi:hypothetical protein
MQHTVFRFLSACAAAGFAASLSGCIVGGKEDKPLGSEIENELGARIFLADGTPAAGATVRVLPVDNRPAAAPKGSAAQGLAFSTRTDAQGRYRLDSLPKGEYNILSDKDGAVAIQDSVFISGRQATLASDTLREPGTLIGFVRMQPLDDPRSVIVQALGTNTWANVDDSGRFELDGLAQGAYRLRLESDLTGYTPTFANAAARSGSADTLRPDVVLTYTGIPVVEGLSAAFDTVCGCAVLHWKPTRYSAFGEYLVMRKRAGDVASPVPIARTTDTVYSDPVYRYSAWPADPDHQDFEYRVAVVNRADQVGRTNGAVVALAASPSLASTVLAIAPKEAHGGRISLHDSVTFVAQYSNPGRRILRVRWYLPGSADPIRDIPSRYHTGEDALRMRYDSLGIQKVRCEAVDEAGTVWAADGQVNVVRDVPVPFLARSLSVYAGEPFTISSGSFAEFGKIVSWEWDVGATGHFTPGGTDTTLAVPVTGQIPVVLRVIDEDTNQAQATLMVISNRRPGMVPIPAGTVTTFDGRTVPIGGFRMQNVEVTLAQWTRSYGSEPDPAADSSSPVNLPNSIAKWYCNRRSGSEGLPVAYDLITGRLINPNGGYRLPTQEEWQYAAQAGKGRMDWEWEDPDSLETYVWHDKNSGGRKHPVGWKAANAFGLYDMAGNMGEATEDFQPPIAGSPIPWHWYRFGGSWADNYSGLNGFVRDYTGEGGSSSSIGFRVVLPGSGP